MAVPFKSRTIIPYGQWGEAWRILGIGAAGGFNKVIDTVVKQEAQYFAKMVKKNIDQQGTVGGKAFGGKPFARITRGTYYKRRFRRIRGKRALLARRDLRKAIKAKRVEHGRWFAGVLNTARDSAGRHVLQRAIVHEAGHRGIKIAATQSMLNFLYLLYKYKGDFSRKLKTSKKGGDKGVVTTIVINIPKRSYLLSTFDALYDRNRVAARNKVLARFALLSGGKLGKFLAPVPRT